jgi:hypothetical protein
MQEPHYQIEQFMQDPHYQRGRVGALVLIATGCAVFNDFTHGF